jgi:hypothetical protein
VVVGGTEVLNQWAVSPPGRAVGVLEVGSSDRGILLFTIEVTSDQTLRSRYHFIKPVHRMKTLLTVKLLNVVKKRQSYP